MNETTGMEQAMLAQDSWVLALEGIFALIIGFLILFWPAMSLVTLTLFVGAFALVSGIFTLVGALKAKKGNRGLEILHGVAGIIFGCIIFAWPIATTVMLLWFVMAWLVVSGIFRIVAGFSLPKGDMSKGLLILNGFLALIIGILLIALPPGEGLLTTAILIGFYGIFGGITLIMLSFMSKSVQSQMGA